VTITPTITLTTSTHGFTVSDVSDGPRPAAVRPLMITVARPTPPAKPSRPPIRPTSNASTNSVRVTCARLAPMARSSAFSRWRWAALMLKTLKMMNEPTNSEMTAKMVRKIVKNCRPSSTALWFSSVISCPVSASMSRPSYCCSIRSASCWSSSVPSPTTAIESTRPG
jgi:hypothetical protein